MPLLALTSKTVEDIAKEIYRGDFSSFLDLKLYYYFEEVCINAQLIMKIKDFDLHFKYLDEYLNHADSWASCDNLKFSIKKDRERLWDKMLEYRADERPFVRRIAVRILFSYIEEEDYLPRIFDMLNSFFEEREYYVNMCLAWLVCELFIKKRVETLEFLKTHRLNDFTINRAVQKCRDSFRVSAEDKEFLKKYKV